MPQAHDGAKGCGLARTVAPEQHGELATCHNKVNAMQDVVRTDMGVHAIEFE
jgi:tRNA U38,U39,U40 pseudouridine synthase TruA